MISKFYSFKSSMNCTMMKQDTRVGCMPELPVGGGLRRRNTDGDSDMGSNGSTIAAAATSKAIGTGTGTGTGTCIMSPGRQKQKITVVDIAQDHSKKRVIWGRESHTSNVDAYDRYIERLRTIERNIECDHPFQPKLWSFIRSILVQAQDPVGFQELNDPMECVPKGPTHSMKFIERVMSIGLINPVHPILLAEAADVPLDEVLTELCYATKVGLFKMVWSPECERCGSMVTSEAHLGDLPITGDAATTTVDGDDDAASRSSHGSMSSSRRGKNLVHCRGCHYPNAINSLDRIKVVFNMNEEVLYILADNYACTPSQASMEQNAIFAIVPATSTGSGFRYAAGCRSSYQLSDDSSRTSVNSIPNSVDENDDEGVETTLVERRIVENVPSTAPLHDVDDEAVCDDLTPGRYRMHCPVARTDAYLVVKRKAEEDDEPIRLKLPVSEMVIEDPSMPRKVYFVEHGKIQFDVLPDTKSFFVLWIQKDVDTDNDNDVLFRLPHGERSPYTPASQAIHHPTFQRLFKQQMNLGGGVKNNGTKRRTSLTGTTNNSSGIIRDEYYLQVEQVVLVFTDVVGSTSLYATLGDGEALRVVRKHFEIVFGAFASKGRVVKTIGDAVMGSFISGRAAIEAVCEALRGLASDCILPHTGEPLQIRVGMHCGSAIVVPLNGINDYFGQTVNVAARVESKAGPFECVITDAVLRSDPDAQRAFEEQLSTTSTSRVALTTSASTQTSGPKDQDGLPSMLENRGHFEALEEKQLLLKGVADPVRVRGLRFVVD